MFCFAITLGQHLPVGSWAPLVLPHGGSYTQITTGLHWPGFRCILGALDIISIAAWMFAVVAAMADSFMGGSSEELSGDAAAAGSSIRILHTSIHSWLC